MARIINPAWQAKIRSKIEAHRADGTPFDETVGVPMCVNWMILQLAERNIAFKVISIGGSVKRVTTQVDVCPKCNGTGKC